MILVTLAGFLASSAFFSKITVPVDASIRIAACAWTCGPPAASATAAAASAGISGMEAAARFVAVVTNKSSDRNNDMICFISTLHMHSICH